MKAARKRAQAEVEQDVFLAGRPSRQPLDRISGKWVAPILCAPGGDDSPGRPGAAHADAPRAMRCSEISRLLAGVSRKMLTRTLRALERDDPFTRTVTPAAPVTVSHEPTDLGRSLHHMTRGLGSWARTRMAEVLANREKHDSRTS
ncbi:winged helix-turn-helix transcriptional regulator [Streptomyces sp. KL2]|uniref:winged helix-turn-helix transcriptional regulator n=1 Tax=Streptomyces sp. KL2 TaxID=3050126 RepID=UPI00397AA947